MRKGHSLSEEYRWMVKSGYKKNLNKQEALLPREHGCIDKSEYRKDSSKQGALTNWRA